LKYQRFGSAAHNFARSFASTLNWSEDDYVMSWLSRAALSSGASELNADLLTGDAAPPELVDSHVSVSIRARIAYLPRHLEAEGVSIDSVEQAQLRLRFDLDGVVRDPVSRVIRIPFVAEVRIRDDRGIEHVGSYQDTWLGDCKEPKPRGRRWRRFCEPAA
jgi:hypothetical protein